MDEHPPREIKFKEIKGGKGRKNYGRRIAILICLSLAALIGITTFFSSVNIIQDGTVGVVRRFGEITETITPGGWNVRLSWIHDVEIFDVRTREATMQFNAYSVDAQNIRGQMSIQYRLNPGTVQSVAREFGTLEQLESMIHAMFNQQILNTIASRTATYLIEQMYLVEGEVHGRILPNEANFHITVTNIALEGLQFSDAFRHAVDQRIVAREHQEQTRIEVETERLRADLALEVARLEGEAVVVAAEADARAVGVMLEVWDDLTADVREIMLRQLAIESWDGSLPNVVGSGEFSFILDNFGG
ncbi:MAG: SPFH domain-containing protein [Defluviitaleaceae bacterium]|nr:SPFH domain-containing protein [Defluviitaleaceae bacterium]